MQLNSIIFPAPPSSYSTDSEEMMIWIPKQKTLINNMPDFSLTFNTLKHKKSSSFDFKCKLFSPKFNFKTKNSNLCGKINKSVHKSPFSLEYLPTENNPLSIKDEIHSLLSKKTIENFILNRKKTYSNIDNSSEKTDKNSIPSSNVIEQMKKRPTKISDPLEIEKIQSDFKKTPHKIDFLTFLSKCSKNNMFLGPKHHKSPSDSNLKVSLNKKIPCFLLQNHSGSNVILLHFHGNAEDIGDSLKYMKKLSSELQVKAAKNFIIIIL